MVQTVERRKKLAAQVYLTKYQNFVRQWNQEGEDAFWLMYSANYLFRWGGARWAVDPLTLAARIPTPYPSRPALDFERCNFIVLTHRHSDHLDIKLLKDLSRLNISWVIPEFLLSEVRKNICLMDSNIMVPKAGELFDLNGIKILPFEGSHWENPIENRTDGTSVQGVPSFSYLFEAAQKRWLISGDTRCYDSDKIPAIGSLNGLISHVWLGRKSALMEPPPLLEQFCNYQLAFETKRIVLTHLEEWGRDESDLWTVQHAEKIIEYIHKVSPTYPVSYALTGQCVPLAEDQT